MTCCDCQILIIDAGFEAASAWLSLAHSHFRYRSIKVNDKLTYKRERSMIYLLTFGRISTSYKKIDRKRKK